MSEKKSITSGLHSILIATVVHRWRQLRRGAQMAPRRSCRHLPLADGARGRWRHVEAPSASKPTDGADGALFRQ